MGERIIVHHNVAHVVADWPVPLEVSADVWFVSYSVASVPPIIGVLRPRVGVPRQTVLGIHLPCLHTHRMCGYWTASVVRSPLSVLPVAPGDTRAFCVHQQRVQ
jgi:hypothetical protein